MAGIFKAYDIRGIYGETLTDDTAFRIGRAFATFLGGGTIVVGRDMRSHSEPIFEALSRGLTRQGADVVDIGLCSTPMSYYANGRIGAAGSIMITASHNPGEWNGFKLCREQAIPISGDTGIADIERIVQDEAYAPEPDRAGTVTRRPELCDAYIEHIRSFARFQRPLRIAVDYANGMGDVEGRVLDGLLDQEPLFREMDGTFPNHEANPLKAETLDAVRARLREGGFDFGIAFDGDADRVGFLDETGEIIPMDAITALIAQTLLRETPGAPIYYDLRSSWAVREIIEEAGGKPMMSRVGHAFIKQQMRDSDALFAGELSGHYYFRENYFTESSALAVILVAGQVSASDKPISEWIRPLLRYQASGEINSDVADTAAVFERLLERYGKDGRVIRLDGVSVEFDDWWFNVRASNTEPLVRLNLEARTRTLMEQKRDDVLALIRA